MSFGLLRSQAVALPRPDHQHQSLHGKATAIHGGFSCVLYWGHLERDVSNKYARGEQPCQNAVRFLHACTDKTSAYSPAQKCRTCSISCSSTSDSILKWKPASSCVASALARCLSVNSISSSPLSPGLSRWLRDSPGRGSSPRPFLFPHD